MAWSTSNPVSEALKLPKGRLCVKVSGFAIEVDASDELVLEAATALIAHKTQKEYKTKAELIAGLNDFERTNYFAA